ncbi:MAG: universal stress protein [Gammaproteobacteria bacterium]|nr:universal stress protein [Gammaproteobacteria bacterium]
MPNCCTGWQNLAVCPLITAICLHRTFITSLPVTVEKLGAELIVMGAISHSRIDELLVGNTAERVLDSLECDVLLHHP